jgi:phage/plasmid-like protein (TIGR03299 family)
MTADVQTMFSVGERPWHGLGHVLDAAPTCRDAIKLAGLDWRVDLRPMWTTLPGVDMPVPVPGQRAVVREDNATILGVVGEGFTPLQNADAFAFFEPLVSEGLLSLETAGALREGRRVWIMAKIPGDPAEIVAGDLVDRYVLMCHGHDGSLALRAGFNPVRVVCQNTLSLALDSGDGMVCLRHTSGLAAGLARLRTVIGQQIEIFNGTADAWRLLAARSCDDASFTAYVLRLLALTRGEGDDAARVIEPDATVGRRLLEDVRPLFEGGVGNDRAGVRGTWWAAYNAVTEWLTHHRGSPAGTEREQAERRFDSLHLGPGRRLGVRALMLALDAAHDAPAAETPAPVRDDAPPTPPLPASDLG